jgi:hypothetical protein
MGKAFHNKTNNTSFTICGVPKLEIWFLQNNTKIFNLCTLTFGLGASCHGHTRVLFIASRKGEGRERLCSSTSHGWEGHDRSSRGEARVPARSKPSAAHDRGRRRRACCRACCDGERAVELAATARWKKHGVQRLRGELDAWSGGCLGHDMGRNEPHGGSRRGRRGRL